MHCIRKWQSGRISRRGVPRLVTPARRPTSCVSDSARRAARKPGWLISGPPCQPYSLAGRVRNRFERVVPGKNFRNFAATAKSKPQFRRLQFIHQAIHKGQYPNCRTLVRDWETSPKTIRRGMSI